MPRHGIQLDELRAKAQTLARKFGIRRWERERGALGLVEHAGSQRNLFGPEREDIELALELVALARYEVDVAESRLISVAREQHLSWAEIASRLNLSSRQAAEQRSLRLQAVDRQTGAWRERDPQLARNERRRKEQLVHTISDIMPFLQEFSSSIQQDVVAFPDRWEKLPDNGTDVDRRHTTVLLETRLRALRSASGRVGGTLSIAQSLFYALQGLVTTLLGAGYPIEDLPAKLREQIAQFERLDAELGELMPPPRRPPVK